MAPSFCDRQGGGGPVGVALSDGVFWHPWKARGVKGLQKLSWWNFCLCWVSGDSPDQNKIPKLQIRGFWGILPSQRNSSDIKK